MGRRRSEDGMGNLAALVLRVALGGLMAGHGSQKAFGWFNGPGLEGTSGFMEMLGLRPGGRGRPWRRSPSLAGACSRCWGYSIPWVLSGSSAP